MPTSSWFCSGPSSYLHHVLDQRLVGADLGALQAADALADPGDERELGPLAQGVARREADEAEQRDVIWGRGERERSCRTPTQLTPVWWF